MLYKNSIIRLSFFLLSVTVPYISMAAGKDTVENKLTVAKYIPSKTKTYGQVTFFESQRFYKLLKKNKKYASYGNLLKWSEKNKIPIIITRRSEYSDTILSVKMQRVNAAK